MESNVAGIETADYEVVEVEHDRRGPDRAVRRRLGRVQHGRAVQQARPRGGRGLPWPSGAHYLDTTGEQDWLITCDEQYGADFAAAGLLLAPGVAQMYTTGEIAAEVASSSPASTPSTSRCSGVAARRSRRR